MPDVTKLTTMRQELHALLDTIPDNEVRTTGKILRALADPVRLAILTAPIDDEPETAEERAEVEVARGETGPGTPHAEVRREFGM